MLHNRRNPVVFGGPSLALLSPKARGQCVLNPPIRRGDLEALSSSKRPGTAILVDGVFGSSLSVTPLECRILISAGWLLIGASSMGALRAAELWSAGMVGIGEVYSLLRAGVVRSDADVATLYSEDGERELTASMVHVRSIVQEVFDRGLLSMTAARKAVRAAQDIFWVDRAWSEVSAAWSDAGIASAAIDLALKLNTMPEHHPKCRDAKNAVHAALAHVWTASPLEHHVRVH
jgi:TfuA protein